MEESKPFICQRRVEFADTDMAGIVHFASYFRYMETAEHEFLRQVCNLGIFDVHEDLPFSWPRVSASCDYVGPVRFGDVLQIKVSIERIGAKSVTYQFDLFVEDRVVARGKHVVVCCHTPHVTQRKEQIKAIEIPPAIREKLERAARSQG